MSLASKVGCRKFTSKRRSKCPLGFRKLKSRLNIFLLSKLKRKLGLLLAPNGIYVAIEMISFSADAENDPLH